MSCGFWPAQREGEDILVYADENRRRELLCFNMLRQQTIREDGGPSLPLGDFVAPRSSGAADCIGAFAVTSALGCDELVRAYESANDDYMAILVKALAERLAAAFGERLHARVRRELGFGASENLTVEDMLDEKFRGIRPAFGYPACRDHTEQQMVFSLLDAPEAGIRRADPDAMLPAASVSGLSLSHASARDFSVGIVTADQVEAYARAKALSVAEVERWLAPNLGDKARKIRKSVCGVADGRANVV